jgi:hypothetical protein
MFEKLGLRVATTDYEYLDEGAYSVVFVDRAQGKVCKVYLATQPIDHSRKVFAEEIEAYKKANAQKDLKSLVPAFYATTSIQQIIDKDGNDVTSKFYPALAFESEHIPQRFKKANMAAPEKELARVKDLFRKHGINHLSDISAWVEEGKIRKVLDFAVNEIVPSWDD